MNLSWNDLLTDQLVWHWDNQLRPRLAGLTDDEYFWEPVQGCWNVRPRGTSTARLSVGAGEWTIDFAVPEPDPPPVTTIAWRLGHVIVGVLGARNHSHFGGPPADYETWLYAGTAAEALDQLQAGYDEWLAGVRSLSEQGLARPCGPAEGPFADHPMAALVLHIHREVIHHLSEVSLLRDLYAHQPASAR